MWNTHRDPSHHIPSHPITTQPLWAQPDNPAPPGRLLGEQHCSTHAKPKQLTAEPPACLPAGQAGSTCPTKPIRACAQSPHCTVQAGPPVVGASSWQHCREHNTTARVSRAGPLLANPNAGNLARLQNPMAASLTRRGSCCSCQANMQW